jgi:hypothetical protein
MIAGLFAFAAATASQPGQAIHCHKVHGRYGIYVTNDLLHISGSKHLLVVVNEDLDRELIRRGWESTVVFGDFTLCTKETRALRDLTRRDDVWLTAVSNIRYLKR